MSCGERTPKENFKIIGGSRTSIEFQPWLASIFEGRTFICGGTLIAPCWVLSAAHCFTDGYVMCLRLNVIFIWCSTVWNAVILHCLLDSNSKKTTKDQYTVYLGKDATNQTDLRKEQKFKVAKLVLHQDFDYEAEDFNNDIGMHLTN